MKLQTSAGFDGLLSVPFEYVINSNDCKKTGHMRSVILKFYINSDGYKIMFVKKGRKKLSGPQNRHRSVKMAFETLGIQAFQIPRVRITASIRED
jgi:hypothetical protein